MKMNLDPDLGDLEEMLAHVQTQLEQEIDLEKESKMPSVINIQESPRAIKRSPPLNRAETFDIRRQAPRPPLARVHSDLNGDEKLGYMELSRHDKLRGSQTSLRSDDAASQASFQSFRSEPAQGQRHSAFGLPQDKRVSSSSLNGKGRTATLPRGYGSSKEKATWEEYWAW